MRAEFYGFAKQNRRQCRRSKTPRLSRRLSQASGCLLVCFTRLWLHPQSFRVLRSSLPLPSGRGLGWGKSAQPTTIHYSFFTFHYSLKCGLLPPLKGEVPRRAEGLPPPRKPQAVVEGFIAPYGANRSNIRSLRSLSWNGGGEINPFPEFYVNLTCALRDYLISPPCRASPDWGSAPNPAGALPPSPQALF